MAINDILVRVGADISGYTRNLSLARAQLTTFATAAQQMGVAAAAGFGVMAASGVMAVGSVVKSASSFESAFASVRKTVDMSEKGFAKLRTGILDMSKELPATANEIAEVTAAAGQLGIKNKHLLSFTRTMIDLGVATDMSANDAAMALARLANITGMSQKDFDRLGSTIVELGNNFAASESEISEMALRIAGAGTQINMSEADILGFSAALTSVGIRAEAGGSAISRLMIEMASQVSTGGKNLQEFARIADMSVGDFKQAFEKDAAGAIMTFLGGLSELSDEGESAFKIIDELGLGEIRLRDTILRTSNAQEMATDAIATANKAWGENTALTAEAEERYKTFESKLQVLKNTLEVIKITLGGPFLDALIAIMDAIQPVIDNVEKLAIKFAEMDGKAQMFITMGVLIATVLAAIGAVLGVIIAVIGTVVISLGALAAAVGTTVAGLLGFAGIAAGVVTVIGAIIGAVIWAYTEFEWFRDVVLNVWESVKEATSTAFQFISEIITTVLTEVSEFVQEIFGNIVEFWAEHGEMITEAATIAWNKVYTAISDALDVIFSVIKTVFNVAADVVIAAWDVIKLTISAATEFIMGIIQFFAALFTGDWDAMWSAVERITDAALSFIDGIIETVMDAIYTTISDIWNGILDIITTIAEKIKKKVEEIFNSLEGVVATAFEWVVSAVDDGINNALDVVTNIKDKFKEAGGNIVKSIGEGITGAADKVTTAISTVTEKIRGYLPFSPAKFGALRDIMNVKIAESIAESIEKGKGTAVKAMASLAKGVQNAAPDDLKLDGLNTRRLRGAMSRVVSEIDANVMDGGGGIYAELAALREQAELQTNELRKQKQLRVEMDKRIVGELVEPVVSEKQKFNEKFYRRNTGGGYSY